MGSYVLSIDQSTQGTKAILFDERGGLIKRCDLPHKQIVNEKGWVEHDPLEIYNNTLKVVEKLIVETKIGANEIKALGISNQRETAVLWNRQTGAPIYNAIVWQCSRGENICKNIQEQGFAQLIQAHTGLKLSPYFTAAKITWVLQNVPFAKELSQQGNLCVGTIDAWLIFKLTGGKHFKTDYSNASRTQLLNILELKWDKQICDIFGIDEHSLPELTDSNGLFGETNFDGLLNYNIPIHAAMGDSHGALFGQGCLNEGMIKATYGSGSSVMMNTGNSPIFSRNVVTSLAWSMSSVVNYVLEGNINYTGSIISWLKNDLRLISNDSETEELAKSANVSDETYLVPAFSGLGAPYWDADAKACIYGMGRTTGKAEIVKAALESIAYQITDVIKIMSQDSNFEIKELRVDGGPTKNAYLMQFQSDIAGIKVGIPKEEELSAIGVAYAAGITIGLYNKETLFNDAMKATFVSSMNEIVRQKKYKGWKQAVSKSLTQPQDL